MNHAPTRTDWRLRKEGGERVAQPPRKKRDPQKGDPHDRSRSPPLPHRRSGRGSPRPPPTHRGHAVPEKETVADESQGVPLATIQELARYWATDYDWRKCEAKLNALPQFMTEIDGLDIHFIHV